MYIISILIAIFLSFSALKAFASESVIDPKLDFQDLTSNVETYDLLPGATGGSDFANFPFSSFSTSSATPEINRGYSNSQLWLRVELSNPTQQKIDRVLYFSSPLTGAVKFHVGDHALLSGSSVPVAQRVIRSRLTAFPVTLEPAAHQTFYIEQHSQHALASRLQIASPERFKQVDTEDASFVFFYLGGILCLIVYNLFVGLFARDPNFFYYALFSGSYVAATLALNGFLDVFFALFFCHDGW